MSSSSYPAAELMKLSEAKTFCIFDHHNCCIRNINPDFDHRRGYKDLDLIFPECFHDLIFLCLLHFSVKAAYMNTIPQFFCEHLRVVDNIFGIQTFTFLYHRTDHIALSYPLNLFSHKTICFFPIFSIYDTIFYRQSVFWHFIDNRNVKIAI